MLNVYMEMNLQKVDFKANFPKGYKFEHIKRSQGYLWERVMNETFGNYPPGDFEYIMVNNYSYLPERVFILFDELRQPCGTASAWSQPWRWGNDYGYIIFVGVIPSHRGKGLAREIVLDICNTIKNRGQNFALLDVDSENLAAIKCYLNAGFLPRLTSENESAIWDGIFAKLKIEPVKYSNLILQPMNNPHPPRPYLLDLRAKGVQIK